MPWVSSWTTLSLRPIIVLRSRVSPVVLMPWWANSWFATSKWCDDCNSAFDGMQPTLRHVPPKVPYFSTMAVFRPSCAARMAAT